MENEVLNSWKEIASFLGRGVRTVQRWESHHRLPVHRPAGKDRSAVFALKHEVKHWQQSCPTHPDGKLVVSDTTEKLQRNINRFLQGSNRLRSNAIRMQEEFQRMMSLRGQINGRK